MSSNPGSVGYKIYIYGTYPMSIEPTITLLPSGFSGYIIWLDTQIVFKKTEMLQMIAVRSEQYQCISAFRN